MPWLPEVLDLGGLALHASLKRSRRAVLLARGMAVLAGAAFAVGVQTLAGEGGAAWALALGAGLLLTLCALVFSRKTPFHSVAVDAGGNWALADDSGWHDFSVFRIWVSPLGWLTLAGELAGKPGQGRGGRAQLTLWADSVSPADWRALRIAANWTRQRGEGLLMPVSAHDPRREAQS